MNPTPFDPVVGQVANWTGRVMRAFRRGRRQSRDRIRVTLLINTLTPYGAETFVANHARFADHGRFAMTVCYFGGSDALASTIQSTGARVICLRGRRDPRAVARLGAFLREDKTEVLQTHVTYSGVVGRLAARVVGVPAVVSTEQNVRSEYSTLWARSTDLTFRLADENVFISRAVLRSFEGVFPHLSNPQTPIIPNGIDAAGIAEVASAARSDVRHELGLARSDFAFVQVGRLHPTKDHETSLRAFAAVHAEFPQSRLFFIGDGPHESTLRGLVTNAGLNAAVTFLGRRLDVHRLLGGFDALVHPSKAEALGIAVLESLAAGLPTITSDVDGLPEFIMPGKTGWLHPVGDSVTLAERMGEVLQNQASAKRIAHSAQAFVRDHYDIRQSVRAYEALYLCLLGAQ